MVARFKTMQPRGESLKLGHADFSLHENGIITLILKRLFAPPYERKKSDLRRIQPQVLTLRFNGRAKNFIIHSFHPRTSKIKAGIIKKLHQESKF